MKKIIIKLMAIITMLVMLTGCSSILSAPAGEINMDNLLNAARAEGSLTVYGSCDEQYLVAACENFAELYGIKVDYERLSTGEVFTKITNEKGAPSADVWFGGTTDPYNEAAVANLLQPYEAQNAKRLLNDSYKDATGNWYGIYKGILGFVVNIQKLQELNLEAPKDWNDLLNPKYEGLISFANPSTSGTSKLIINTIVQMKGHSKAMEYFASIDKNIKKYPKSGSDPIKMVSNGEAAISVGFLHDGINIILQGSNNMALVVPKSGTSYEIGATAILKGAQHPNAAKLWIEYALSPECVNLAKSNGSYQFLVIENAQQPKEATDFALNPENVIKYDFKDAKENTSKYVDEFFVAVGGKTDKFEG